MATALRGAYRKEKPIKIALIQDNPGSNIRKPYMERMRNFKPDLIAFPEYYFVGPQFDTPLSSLSIGDEIMDRLRWWSRDLGCIVVGGTMVEESNGKKFNRCYLLDKGEIVGSYDKIHLFKSEGQGFLSPGTEYRVFQIGGIRIGLLICADALFPDAFNNIRGLGPDIIFIPTTSQLRRGELKEEKFKRDMDIFAAGATAANAALIKISASGVLAGRPLQGRSLIAISGSIAWRIEPENEDKPALIEAVLIGDLRNPSIDITVYR